MSFEVDVPRITRENGKISMEISPNADEDIILKPNHGLKVTYSAEKWLDVASEIIKQAKAELEARARKLLEVYDV